MSPREVIETFIKHFTAGDAKSLAALYDVDAEHDRIALDTVRGRDTLYAMFDKSFARQTPVFAWTSMLVDGNKVLLEWKDGAGMRGCNVFEIENSLIRYQRSYWDKESFKRFHPDMFKTAEEASR